MSETRKIAAILVADVVGYSRLAGSDEDRTLSRLRGLRSDLIDPAIAAHHGRHTNSAASTFKASATRPSTVTVIDACARSIRPTYRGLSLRDRRDLPEYSCPSSRISLMCRENIAVRALIAARLIYAASRQGSEA
jgi:class 3 adenylate cyclase